MVLIFVFCLVEEIKEVEPARILIIAPPVYSHCSQIASLGKTLHQRGHSVWAFVGDAHDTDKCFDNANVQLVKYKVNRDDLSFFTQLTSKKLSNLMEVVRQFSRLSQIFCSAVLGDAEALKTLGEIQFDISIVWTVPPMRCSLLIPHKFGIPFVSLSVIHFWFDYGKSFHPTMENNPLTYSQKMFFQRLGSTVLNLAFPFVTAWAYHFEVNNVFMPNLSYVDYLQLIHKAKLFIQDDDFVLYGAFPTMPNIKHTGGFFRRSANLLPQHLVRFYNTAPSKTHGVIFTSFGSVLDSVSIDFNNELVKCFTSLQQSVLWKLKDKVVEEELSKNSSSNILTSHWIPQNDVLGHNKTRLFISHCGRKSFYEAIHHAIPLICIPFFGDQPSVAAQVKYHGIGIQLENDKVTSDILCNTIQEILSNNSYMKNMKRVSSIYQELHPEPAEVVASRAIEHVIKYGGQHLRPQSMDMSIISHLMLDVWIPFGLICVMTCVLPLYFCFRCFRFARSEKAKYKIQ